MIRIFNDLFLISENTRLVRGDDEPIYLPASMTGSEHQVIFAHGFYASAMHEIAHWCVAGAKRRLLEDYGYWYEPDGRTEQQQRLFETVEVVPQAMEKCFCSAAGFPFRVSVDNLNGSPGDTSGFSHNVDLKAQKYLNHGLPGRAQRFFDALADYYQTGSVTVLSPDVRHLSDKKVSIMLAEC
nr:elongation factor P hydroxylase [Oceanospirillum sediminis]